jgi:hypothetical protein
MSNEVPTHRSYSSRQIVQIVTARNDEELLPIRGHVRQYVVGQQFHVGVRVQPRELRQEIRHFPHVRRGFIVMAIHHNSKLFLPMNSLKNRKVGTQRIGQFEVK